MTHLSMFRNRLPTYFTYLRQQIIFRLFMKSENHDDENTIIVAMIPMMMIIKVIISMTMAIMKTTNTYIACLWVHGSSELDFRATPSIIPERVKI